MTTSTQDDVRRIELLLELGEAELHRAPRAALARAREVLALVGDADHELMVPARQLEGSAHYGLGEVALAIERFSDALAMERRSEPGDGLREAAVLLGLAKAHLRAGDAVLALEHVEAAEAIPGSESRAALVAEGLTTRGTALLWLGKPLEALPCHQEAVRVAHAAGDTQTELQAMVALAELESSLGGGHEAALEHLLEAVRRARECGAPAIEARGLCTLAIVHHRSGRNGEVLALGEQACRVAQDCGERVLEAEALRIMWNALRVRDEDERARSCLHRAVEALEGTGARMSTANVLSALAQDLMDAGEPEEARRVSERVLAIGEQHGLAQTRFIGHLQVAAADQACDRFGAALEALERALAAAEVTEVPGMTAAVHRAASEVLAASGDAEAALERHKRFHEAELAARAATSDRRLAYLRLAHESARAEREARESDEQLRGGILDSMPHRVAVLDESGHITAVNERWLAFGREAGALEARIGIGMSYLDVCETAAVGGDEGADEARAGIADVMAGRRAKFELEYLCESRWFRMSVIPFESQRGGVVVVHEDVTERKEDSLALAAALEEVSALKDRYEAESQYLTEEIRRERDFGEIVGESGPMQKAFDLVERVAGTDMTVLLLGETGTGKELFARAIHERSKRKDRPVIKVDCAALPGGLIESELLGHEKGAFTGAHVAKPGRFELADGGTIFLDEVGELPLDLQVKLLRVLQDGELERVGSTKVRQVDVRVIAATNRDLAGAVKRGEFRSDLYYRLNGFPIELPPLRHRQGDVPLLVWHALRRGQERLGRQIDRIPRETMDALEAYTWPGNVRELFAVIERAMLLSSDTTLARPDLAQPGSEAEAGTLADAERTHIERVLEACGWRIKGAGNAAERLGMPPSSLRHRMKKLGIRRPSTE